MSRRRTPTPDELELWGKVAETVSPLEKRPPRVKPKPSAEPPKAEASKSRKSATATTPVASPKPPPPAQPPKLNPIDRRTRSRVRRGAIDIDARIDLHGVTQEAAHGRLLRFLKQAQADGARLVLVITGKGKPGGEPDGWQRDERGVLRRAVPIWLSSAELRPLVIGFDEASPGHGGIGALYVRVRRAR